MVLQSLSLSLSLSLSPPLFLSLSLFEQHLKLPNKVTKLHQTQLNEKEKVIYDILFSQGR